MLRWPKIKQKHHTTNENFLRDHGNTFTLILLVKYMWFIMVDAHSKRPIAIPTKDTSAENTVEMMLDTFTTHGLCEQIVSDNGSQFTSEVFQQTKRNAAYSYSSVPSPVKWRSREIVQTFKSSLKKCMLSGEKLIPALRNFLVKYRITPHSTTGIAPCELLFKHHLRTRLDLLQPTSIDVQNHMDVKKPVTFTEGEKVWARNYQHGHKWVPGEIHVLVGLAQPCIESKLTKSMETSCSSAKYKQD